MTVANDITNLTQHSLHFDSPNKDISHLLNKNLKMNGLDLLNLISKNTIKACFFDPQYRGILDKLGYGNEGKSRETRRCALQQMTEEIIIEFLQNISRVLTPSGHLFLWIDKFHLCEGVSHWFANTEFSIVDLITNIEYSKNIAY